MNNLSGYLSLILLYLTVGASAVFAQTREQCDSIVDKAVEYTYNKEYEKSLELLERSRALAQNHHWYKQEYNAVFNMGLTYYFMLDYAEAMDLYLESYNIAVKELEPKDEISALNNIANVYMRQKLYPKALEYYTKAFETAKENKVEKRMGIPLMNIGMIYNKLNKPVKARPYLVESLQHMKKYDDSISAQVLIAENDMLLGNTTKARMASFTMLKKYPELYKYDLNTYLWQVIAESYLKDKDYTNAEAYARKVIKASKDEEVSRDNYELLAKIYAATHSYDKALVAKDSVISLNTKITELTNGRLFENNRVKFELQNYRNEVANKEEKIRVERITFISSLVALIAAVIILVLVFRHKSLKAEQLRNQAALSLEMEKNLNLQLEKQITDALLEQEHLKDAVEERSRKLSAKALYLSDRNEVIEEIVEYLSKKPRYAADRTLSAYVRSLKDNLRTDNEYSSFFTHFEEVNHGFLTRLKKQYPTLNANDLRFVAYLKMNLTIKEIASILNITIVACKKRKERLATKMELTKEIDLFDHISVL